jgi:hypothetical protein
MRRTFKLGVGRPLPTLASLTQIAEPIKIDVSAYHGVSSKRTKFFQDEDYYENSSFEVPTESFNYRPKHNTSRKYNKSWAWKNRQQNSYRNEQKLFQEIMHELETINIDEYVNCIQQILVNSKILRDHVDVIYEFNKDMFAWKQELYLKIRKLTNEKYKTILIHKLHALWQP